MRHTHTHSHTHTRPQVCLADLMDAEGDYTNRKVTLKAEDVQGRNVITNFHGMSLTTDKLKSLLAKWCTLVEGSLEVKTSDGYTLRVFAIGFTKKRRSQVRRVFPSPHGQHVVSFMMPLFGRRRAENSSFTHFPSSSPHTHFVTGEEELPLPDVAREEDPHEDGGDHHEHRDEEPPGQGRGDPA